MSYGEIRLITELKECLFWGISRVPSISLLVAQPMNVYYFLLYACKIYFYSHSSFIFLFYNHKFQLKLIIFVSCIVIHAYNKKLWHSDSK